MFFYSWFTPVRGWGCSTMGNSADSNPRFIWEQVSGYSPQGASQSRFLLKIGRFFHPTILPLRVLHIPPITCLILGHIVHSVARGKRGNMDGREPCGFLLHPVCMHPRLVSILQKSGFLAWAFVLKAIQTFCLPTSVVSVWSSFFFFFLPLEISFSLCFEFSCTLSWCNVSNIWVFCIRKRKHGDFLDIE